MLNQKNRVIIDTNLWISFLLTKDFSKLDTVISNNTTQLIFSEELVEEFLEVTQRSKFKKYFSFADVNKLLLEIQNIAVFINVTSNIIGCNDPKDNFLLSLAVDGKATHLITGDKQLLLLKSIRKTKILNLSDYLLKIK